jgi:hypothetical protein
MSGEAVGWAFRKVQMDDPTAKFVLVAICNYADASDKAWPSHEDIARVTGLSKRAVQNNIKKLVDWGIITRVREFRANGSENHPSVYLDLDSRPTVKDGVASGATPQEVPPDMASGATLQTTDTKPQKNLRPAKKQDAPYSEDFEEVWKLAAQLGAPRTKDTSKKKAFDHWRMLNDENRTRVRAAIPAFAAAMKAEGREPKNIKHFEFFLSGRVWETVAVSAAAGAGSPKPFWETATRKDWCDALQLWSYNWNWKKMWGPEPENPMRPNPPGAPKHHVPQDILDRFDLKYRGAMYSPEQKAEIQRRVDEASKHAVDKDRAA